MPSDVSSIQLELTSTICAAVAAAVTLLRLYIRRKTFWIDDFCAVFSMLCLITQMILILAFRGNINTFTLSYLVLITSYATTWSARIAILFTIIRVRNGLQHILIRVALVAVFTLTWGVLTAQLFWVCEPQRNAAAQQNKVCMLNRQVAILHITVSVLADLALLFSALHLFRVIQDSALRHRLKAIFSTCMTTSIVAIIHGVFILREPAGWALLASLVEASVSLIVCSFPMVVNTIFHITPRLVHCSKHSHTYVHSLTFPGALHFAPSPNSGSSSLWTSEHDVYRGYEDPDQTPVMATGLLCKASDFERSYDAIASIAKFESLHPTYMTQTPDSEMIGQQVTRPMPVVQHQ